MMGFANSEILMGIATSTMMIVRLAEYTRIDQMGAGSIQLFTISKRENVSLTKTAHQEIQWAERK